MAANINTVCLTGNLTKDPETREAGSSTVTNLRLAVNVRQKQGDEWGERACYFDVTVWGAQGDNCAKYLEKGRGVAVTGRLDWREWETDEGQKRQAVSIVADQVQFLGGKGDASSGGGSSSEDAPF